ncbi:uncharacterized protein METZ01_LOCUS502495, partial [marine metagenome]
MDIHSRNYWLFLKKSYDERATQGTDDYEYIPGKKYTYDSYVQNHKNIRLDDLVIFRQDDTIIGYGNINEIKSYPSTKIMRRCPRCETAAITTRK